MRHSWRVVSPSEWGTSLDTAGISLLYHIDPLVWAGDKSGRLDRGDASANTRHVSAQLTHPTLSVYMTTRTVRQLSTANVESTQVMYGAFPEVNRTPHAIKNKCALMK